MNKYLRFLTDPAFRFSILTSRGMHRNMTDEAFLKRLYKLIFKKELNLENPVTYNEKLQWLKIHNRKPEYTKMVDKFEVKDYVSDVIGEEYIIPTLGVWDSFDEIDFDSLPEKFVLKCTHDSGGLAICKSKATFDVDKARAKIEKSLRCNYYWNNREWPYKDVKPRIIAEVYMEDEKTAELRDYKFFCFDGVVRAMFIATDRNKPGQEVKFDFFDSEFNHLDMKQGHENAQIAPSKPLQFEKMKELAEKLSKGIPHVRVDFYEVNGKIYFGELTFFHFSGLVPFVPEEWDYKFGEYIDITKIDG